MKQVGQKTDSMQRRCQLVDERDLLNAQPDDPEQDSFKRRVFWCHYGYHSANLYGRTTVNSTRGKTEESLGVLGKKEEIAIKSLSINSHYLIQSDQGSR